MGYLRPLPFIFLSFAACSPVFLFSHSGIKPFEFAIMPLSYGRSFIGAIPTTYYPVAKSQRNSGTGSIQAGRSSGILAPYGRDGEAFPGSD